MKGIKTSRLFYFSEVYKRGSINAAADHLNRVQAGIGRQIQLLEEELGVPLFERGTKGRGMVPGGQGRGMVPTEAAQIVYEFYRQYRDCQDKMEAALQELREMKRGDIHIAVFCSYADALVKDVLNDFCDEYPSLNVQVSDISNSTQGITKILMDEAHIGIIHGCPENPDIRCHARAQLPVRMLVNRHHPLASQGKGTVSDIVSHPLILPPPSHNPGVGAIAQKFHLAPAFVSDSINARKQAAIAGRGGALMSTFAARQEIQAGQLIPFEINHPAFTLMEACLIVRRGRVFSPAANQLLRLIAAKFPIFAPNTANRISEKTLLF